MIEIEGKKYYTTEEFRELVNETNINWFGIMCKNDYYTYTLFGWHNVTDKEQKMIENYLSSVRPDVEWLLKGLKNHDYIDGYRLRVEKKYLYVHVRNNYVGHKSFKIDRREYSENKLRKEIISWVNSRT